MNVPTRNFRTPQVQLFEIRLFSVMTWQKMFLLPLTDGEIKEEDGENVV